MRKVEVGEKSRRWWLKEKLERGKETLINAEYLVMFM